MDTLKITLHPSRASRWMDCSRREDHRIRRRPPPPDVWPIRTVVGLDTHARLAAHFGHDERDRPWEHPRASIRYDQWTRNEGEWRSQVDGMVESGLALLEDGVIMAVERKVERNFRVGFTQADGRRVEVEIKSRGTVDLVYDSPQRSGPVDLKTGQWREADWLQLAMYVALRDSPSDTHAGVLHLPRGTSSGSSRALHWKPVKELRPFATTVLTRVARVAVFGGEPNPLSGGCRYCEDKGCPFHPDPV